MGLFGLKTGLHFAHFGLESGLVFEGKMEAYKRIYRFTSKLNKKEIEISEFEILLNNFLCLRSNLSNDDIISA